MGLHKPFQKALTDTEKHEGRTFDTLNSENSFRNSKRIVPLRHGEEYKTRSKAEVMGKTIACSVEYHDPH